MRRKLRQSQGFTLVEMLAVLLIVALLGLIISAGITAAAKVYRQSRFVAESAVLTSTLNTAVSDVLRYATEVNIVDGQVRFSNRSYQMAQGWLALDDNDEDNGDGEDEEGYMVSWASPEAEAGSLLLNRGAYTALLLKDLSISYDPDTQVFTGTYIIFWPDHEDLTMEAGFTFRTIAENTQPPADPGH